MRTFATMANEHYPLFRRSANGLNHYRVDGPDGFEEVQRVGSRRLYHRVQVRIWPDRLFLAELESCAEGRYVAVDQAAWDAERALCPGA